ncbi:TPA: hypothetical protein DCQ44_01880 [Candidatus Taylorbacteria bacterium]|nr:hypothetical protein [Candidatus Taylorbacteria bacterium]
MGIDVKWILLPIVGASAIFVAFIVGKESGRRELQKETVDAVVAVRFAPIENDKIIVRPVTEILRVSDRVTLNKNVAPISDLFRDGDFLFVSPQVPDGAVIRLKKQKNGHHTIESLKIQ